MPSQPSAMLARSLTERRTTLGQASITLATPKLLAECDAVLLSDENFRRLYSERWDPVLPKLEEAASMPEGSFGRTYFRYMEHYRLSPDFFPIESRVGPEMTPTQYAVHRLNKSHDFLHVLGAYETHDADEVAVQSFVFGHMPVAHAAFLAAAASHPSIVLPHYKHLRDIYEGTIRAEDFERGANSAPLLGLPFEELLETSLAELRRRLGIAARVELPEATGNSCGGLTERPFFTEAA